MKKIVSLLLSVILLVSGMSLYAFAEGDGASPEDTAPELTENLASLGTAISSADSKENPVANIIDGDDATFWNASAAEGSADVFFGINYTKEANVFLYGLSFKVEAGEKKAEYTVELFRNNRWYAVGTVSDDDAVEGVISFELEDPTYTQQVRLVAKTADGKAAALKVFELTLTGKLYNNIAVKGEAYATSFKHYEWTPPHTAIDGQDFEDDWHGWEPLYPQVTVGTNTSAGFGGEHLGIKFTNREYYEVNEIVMYMSMHNSNANPSWGYQDTKYIVEALVEGEWVKIAEFKDSDSIPRDYKDYDEAMKKDTGNYHIASYYTIIPETVVTTNNIRISIDEFAKNYQGDESLVFPYIYEVRVYGEQGEIPSIELPEGALYSADATSNSYPYATSSKTNQYPYLSVDDDINTGWTPGDTKAGQTYGVRFDKAYTIDNVYLLFENAEFSAPYKIEALVNGSWKQIASGNLKDCFVALPEGETYAAQEHTYTVSPVQTTEIRLVFTNALSKDKMPRLNEISANIISSMAGFIKDGVTASAVKSDDGTKNAGIKFNQKQTVNEIKIDFADTSAEMKYFVQAFIGGIWQTIHTEEKLSESSFVHTVYAETDEIRIVYGDNSKAPDIKGITVNTVNYSGDISSYTRLETGFGKNDKTTIDIVYGKVYNIDKIILDHGITDVNCAFTISGLVDGKWVVLGSSNVKSNTKEFKFEAKQISEIKVTYAATSKALPSIKELSANVVGMKTFALDERYSVFQKSSAANGNLAILGTAYANSNYPSLSYETYINDGKKYSKASTWIPKLEEYSAGVEIHCGVKLDAEYTVNKVVVYSSDIGNLAGVGNKFEIQALVDVEYVKIGDGYTCAKDREYCTVYEVTPVKTTDVRISLTNTSIYMPTILELEVYSDTAVPTPFEGHIQTEKIPEVTVFESVAPRFEIAGLPYEG